MLIIKYLVGSDQLKAGQLESGQRKAASEEPGWEISKSGDTPRPEPGTNEKALFDANRAFRIFSVIGLGKWGQEKSEEAGVRRSREAAQSGIRLPSIVGAKGFGSMRHTSMLATSRSASV